MLKKLLASIKTFTITSLTWLIVLYTTFWILLTLFFLLVPMAFLITLCRLLDKKYKITTYTR